MTGAGSARIAVGRARGAPSSQILYRAPAVPSKLGYFNYRYYPQAPADGQAQARKNLSSGVVRTDQQVSVKLEDKLIVSCTPSIGSTSKSAVVRTRICRRLKSALLLELQNHGLACLPPAPMHIVLLPTTRIFNAPFSELREDAFGTFMKAQAKFETFSADKRLKVTPRSIPEARDRKERRLKARPELKGDGHSQKIIQATLKGLPHSAYLNQFGGAHALLERMEAILHGQWPDQEESSG